MVLRRFDEATWLMRRLCQVFDWSLETTDGSPAVDLRPKLIAQVAHAENRQNPALFRPFGAIGGYLEKVLMEPRNDPARQALVWNNMFVANRQRHKVTYTQYSSSENPPQTREWFDDPIITERIDFYVRL